MPVGKIASQPEVVHSDVGIGWDRQPNPSAAQIGESLHELSHGVEVMMTNPVQRGLAKRIAKRHGRESIPFKHHPLIWPEEWRDDDAMDPAGRQDPAQART